MPSVLAPLTAHPHAAPSARRYGLDRQLRYAAMGDIDLAEADRLLTTTRAVRKRLDLTRPVPHELVLECIRVAVQAPAGGNIQRWRWLVVDDPDAKAGLADLYRRAYAPYMEEQRGGRHLWSDRRRSHHVELGLSHRAPPGRPDARHPVLPRPARRNAPQGMLADVRLDPAGGLELHARRPRRGLGTAWTTLHLGYESEAGELLGIPDTVSQVALIPVAYYTGDTFKPGTRRPVEEITYLNRWKQPIA